MEAIGKHYRINVTELAELMGITKGAVSQMVNKLVCKQFVKKMKVARSEKAVFLELTPKGKKAFEGHEKFHKKMVMDFLKYAENISPKDFRKFKEIFTKIEHHLDLYAGTLI
jgi:DNA-binding MarR family transcriptional regulator